MAQSVGTLFVNLVANTSKFQAGMTKASKSVTSFASKFKSIAKGAAGLIGVDSVAGIATMIKRQLSAVDATAKLSQQLGIQTEALVQLQHAADVTGAGSKSMSAGLATMAKRLGEAARGSGAATAALKELGLSAKDLIRLTPDKQFIAIAKALKGIEEPARRNAIAANLFSKANMGLLNTLALGEDGLKAMADEADRLGITFSAFDAAKVEQANDAIDRVAKSFRGLATQAAIDLAPNIENWADNTASALSGLITLVQGAGEISDFIGLLVEAAQVPSDEAAAILSRRTSQELSDIAARQSTLDKRQQDFGAVGEDAIAAQAKLSDSIEQDVVAIERETEALVNNWTAADLLAAKFEDLGASADRVAEIRFAQEELDAAKALVKAQQERTEAIKKTAEAQKKAAEALKDQLKSAGEAVRREFLTPMEQFTERIADLESLLAVGAIGPETFARGARAAHAGLGGGVRDGFAGTALKGSSEAFRSIFKPGGGDSPELSEAKVQSLLLDAILAAVIKEDDEKLVVVNAPRT